MLAVPIGYSNQWFSVGGGVSFTYEHEAGERTSIEGMLGFVPMGVASEADQIISKAAWVPLTVAFKYYPGRRTQEGFYAGAHIGYQSLSIATRDTASLPIETGLAKGFEFHIGLGAMMGYKWEHFEVGLQNHLLLDRTGIAGVKPQQFIGLRFAYQLNFD